MIWEESPAQERVHEFIHTLDMIPRNWYMSIRMQRGTVEWEEIDSSFKHIFEFSHDHPSIDASLQVIKTYLNILQ